MVLGCGCKGLSRGVKLRSKIKCIKVLALQITRLKIKDIIVLRKEINEIKSKMGFFLVGTECLG